MDMSHCKSSVIAYITQFERSGMHHSNTRLRITHDSFIADYFMLLFDLTPKGAASEGQISISDKGSVRLEMQFSKPFP
jgi:hypothetical protein